MQILFALGLKDSYGFKTRLLSNMGYDKKNREWSTLLNIGITIEANIGIILNHLYIVDKCIISESIILIKTSYTFAINLDNISSFKVFIT